MTPRWISLTLLLLLGLAGCAIDDPHGDDYGPPGPPPSSPEWQDAPNVAPGQ